MTTVIILAATVLLFVLAFVTKRRFGALGLGLAAGAVISNSWSNNLASFFAHHGIVASGLSAISIATIVLTLAPALLLLLGGPTYKKPLSAILGGVGFALLGLLLVLGQINAQLSANGSLHNILSFLNTYQSGLVAIGVAIAVVDMFLARTPKHSKRFNH